MLTDRQRLHAVVEKLIDAFFKQHSEMERHTQLLASKEAQQKLQEAVRAIVHGCYAADCQVSADRLAASLCRDG